MSIYDVQKMYIYYNCSASGPPGRPPVAESGHVLYFFPQSVPFSIIRKRCMHVALHCHTDRRDRFIVLSQDHNLLLHHIVLKDVDHVLVWLAFTTGHVLKVSEKEFTGFLTIKGRPIPKYNVRKESEH